MRLEHHLVGGYVRYISPHIIIIIINITVVLYVFCYLRCAIFNIILVYHVPCRIESVQYSIH